MWLAIRFCVQLITQAHARGAGARRAAVVRRLVVQRAGVVPTRTDCSLCGATFLFGVRCAGVIGCGVWFRRPPVVPSGALMPQRQASVSAQPTQPAIPADRFARDPGFLNLILCSALAAAECQTVGRRCPGCTRLGFVAYLSVYTTAH